MNELALTESPALRAQYADRVDALDKVKALNLLPNDMHATTDMVARYFEVTTDVIEKAVQRSRDELERNGLRVIKGAEYREFATDNLSAANSRARSATLFPRRAILNIAMGLRISPVAEQIRTYLLDVEELAPPEVRTTALEIAALTRVQILAYRAAEGLLDKGWLASKTKVALARMVGEEPDLDPADVPAYIPDFLKTKGLTGKQRASVQSWFGRRAASLYEAEHGAKPGKRAEETPTGAIRETFAWTKRDLPVFEETWERWYAADYPAPPVQDSLMEAMS